MESGSGPGGRRFKSSLPDQYFQADKQRFWFFVYTAVGKIEAERSSEFNKLTFLAGFPHPHFETND